MPSFESTIRTAAAHLAQASKELTTLELGERLRPLLDDFARAEFRVSIVGRFKRGKSSVINAFVGQPLVPTDPLPCTSAVIEIRAGQELRVWRESGGGRRRSTLAELLREAGSASADDLSAPDVRWALEAPVAWMPPGFVLVDTPGLDEDEERQALAKSELLRADAALVVLWADQAAHATDLELIAELKERVSLVMVVVNGMDAVPARERDGVLRFVRRKVAPVGIEAERVVPLSAREALRSAPEAQAQLDALRRLTSEGLLTNAAGARLAAMESKLAAALRQLEPQIQEALEQRARASAAAAQEQSRAEQRLKDGRIDREKAARILQQRAAAAAETAGARFSRDWYRLVDQALNQRWRWKSDSDPLLGPKQFALEIGEQAKASLAESIREFTLETLKPTIERELSRARSEIGQLLQGLASSGALEKSGSLEAILADVEVKALEWAFGKALEEASDNSLEAAVAATVSLVVGYIVADVVLFYVMGAISGFLAPPLLLSAAGTGVAAYLFKGRAWVQDWIREKIADKLAEKLKTSDTRQQVVDGVVAATRDVFGKLEKGYVAQLEKLEKRAAQTLKAEKEKAVAAAAASADAHRAAVEARRCLAKLREELQGQAAA